MTQVEIKNLYKSFGSNIAVNDCSFTAETGKVTTILGPSGCGKTTTLRCIAGLETPDGGEIKIGDHVAYSAEKGINRKPKDRDIGMVFQLFAVWPHMTVFDNVAYPLRRKKVPKDEIQERTQESIQMVGLSGKAEEYPPNLSGGQQQRVALARSLVSEPSVLLLDEPFSNLDVNLREQLRRDIDILLDEIEITAIYVTHNQEDAFTLGDKIGIMKGGEMVQIGTMDELFSSPKNTFTANFIGISNLFKGTIVSEYEIDTEIGPINMNNNNKVDIGNNVFAGVRPQDIRILNSQDEKGYNTIESKILFINHKGWMAKLDVEIGDTTLKVECPRTATKQLRRGDTLFIDIDPNNIYLIPA